MRYSEFFLPTLKEVPAEAEVISHQYMLRAGMIRKVASGIYSFLPMGLRALRKVENIIRQEMDRAGALEVFLPSIQPAELWKETGRWDTHGDELLRVKDRHQRDFCYGPTHEEVITDLVRREVRSYRELPLTLYQIQTKFRDEIRPRFGLMRGREFGMKDAYSFDPDEESARESYRKVFEAYKRIFTRLGLAFRPVEADTGNIGGSFSHEFMVLAESGEDSIAFCSGCEYAANVEKAGIGERSPHDEPAEKADLELVETRGKKTVEDVTRFLKVQPDRLIKTLICRTGNGDVAVLVRGDREANEFKIRGVLGTETVHLASPEEVREITGVPAGYVGPVGMKIPIYADQEVRGMADAVVGANREDHHYLHLDPERDLQGAVYADLRNAEVGDPCPRCGADMEKKRGIEVGHVFMLGKTYSEPLHAVYLDKDGKERTIWMGCYGIGVGRTLAAAIEQNHDKDGIRFPFPIAPFQVLITALNPADEKIREAGENLYAMLQRKGVEVLLDDRDERPGKKFKDADLIGIPLRVTIGQKNLKQGNVEMKLREENESQIVPLQSALDRALELIEKHDTSSA
jgi:prolyl-tRNA synthetase